MSPGRCSRPYDSLFLPFLARVDDFAQRVHVESLVDSRRTSFSFRSSSHADRVSQTLPPLPQRVASPPPADYLLSLAMPFYDWSPAETELAFRRSFLSRSTSAEKSRQEGEARSIADDGESAIGLDDEG